MLNKTKAALQGRLSHFTNFAENNITLIDQVNARRFAHIFSNYGKSPVVTAAMARFHIGGCTPLAHTYTKSAGVRATPKFLGDLQSAENSADTWLAEKSADRKRWLGFEPQIPTKGIPSLEQNHRLMGQPFGSIPRDCSSFRRTRFIQVARDESPSFFISASSCIRSSCWSRIWYWSVFALSLDIVITKSILSVGGCNYNVTEMVLQLLNTAKPRSARTLSGLLTKPLTGVTKMAGSQHTQTHPKFTWRFLALSASARNVIHITAATEREAREQSPAGCVMVFAGRLPVQGVSHA